MNFYALFDTVPLNNVKIENRFNNCVSANAVGNWGGFGVTPLEPEILRKLYYLRKGD